MINAILTKDIRLSKPFNARIEFILRKKEFCMLKNLSPILDIISAKERLRIPFSYKWLKFKVGFFGLVLHRGVIK
jgi:hypothetical protein